MDEQVKLLYVRQEKNEVTFPMAQLPAVKQISGHDTEDRTEVEPTGCPELM
jgi:hypothetical protein